jgi:hypothetical protein
VLSPYSLASTLVGKLTSGTTPLFWVLLPPGRKNWAMVSLTWPKRGSSLAGQRSRSTMFCTVPLPKLVSPMIRPRP